MLLSGSPVGRFVHQGAGFRLFSVIPSSLNDWPERRTMEATPVFPYSSEPYGRVSRKGEGGTPEGRWIAMLRLQKGHKENAPGLAGA